MQERLSKLLSGTDIKAIQKIVISLGHISVNETSFPHLKVALDLIFSLCRSKVSDLSKFLLTRNFIDLYALITQNIQVEDILFAAGEALSFIWGGVPVTADMILRSNYVSLSQSTNYLTSEMPIFISNGLHKSSTDNESYGMAQEVIVKKLFDVLLYSSRKEERCAGTVWLVSLTMYCGNHPKIQQLLPETQVREFKSVFMNILACQKFFWYKQCEFSSAYRFEQMFYFFLHGS